MSFFIMGLPRSRTAWLANFMTYGKSFCFHEGLNGCYSIDKYKEKLNGRGDSSTGTMLFDIDEYFPGSKKLIIESDPVDAIKFSYSTYGVGNEAWIYHLRSLLDEQKGLRVYVEEIDENLKKIWEYLSDEPYDRDRGEMLKGLNIQVNNPHDYDVEAAKAVLHELSL